MSVKRLRVQPARDHVQYAPGFPDALSVLLEVSGRLFEDTRLTIRNFAQEFVALNILGKEMLFPIRDIEDSLGEPLSESLIPAIRECIIRNHYLRGFINLEAANVIDIGAKYGIFTTVACVVMEARTVFAFERNRNYNASIDMISICNNVGSDRLVIANNYSLGAGAVSSQSIAEILQTHAVDSIGFLKIDDDRGEAGILLNGGEWLRDVENVILRFGPDGVLQRRLNLIESLSKLGFRMTYGSGWKMNVPMPEASFLYGSRTGNLRC